MITHVINKNLSSIKMKKMQQLIQTKENSKIYTIQTVVRLLYSQ